MTSTLTIAAGQIFDLTTLTVDPTGTVNSDGSISYDVLNNSGTLMILAGDADRFGTIVGNGVISMHPGGLLEAKGPVDTRHALNFVVAGAELLVDRPDLNPYIVEQIAGYRMGSTVLLGSPGTPTGHALAISGVLPSGSWMTSPTGTYVLWMHPNGNLVAYRNPVFGGSFATAAWSTGTSGHAGAYAKLASNGALCVYDASNNLLWAAGAGLGGTTAGIEDTGNVVLYDSTGLPVWCASDAKFTWSYAGQTGDATGVILGQAYVTDPVTVPAGACVVRNGGTNMQGTLLAASMGYALVMATGGAAQLYYTGSASLLPEVGQATPPTWNLLWSTGSVCTHGKPHMDMCANGTLTVYDGDGSVKWSVGSGLGATKFVLTDSGAMQLQKADETVVWDSGTAGRTS
jgi:hypothetical protein